MEMSRAESRVRNGISNDCFLMSSLACFCDSLLLAPCSMLFDHPIRSCENLGWNGDAELLGSFQINDEFKPG